MGLKKRTSSALHYAWIWILVLSMILFLGLAIFWEFNRFRISFNIPASTTLEAGYQEDYQEPEVTAVFRGDYLFTDGFPVKVTKTGKVDTGVMGTYTEEYTAHWLWVKGKLILTITVTDVNPPVLTLHGEADVSIAQGEDWEDPGCSATDDLDGNLTGQISVEGAADTGVCGTYTLTYTAADACGNVGKAVRTVTVKDVTPPRLTLSGDSRIALKAGSRFEDPGYTVTDNSDPEVTVTVDGSVDTSAPGVYILTYRAADASGNQTSVTRTVTVYASNQETGSKIVYLTFDDGPGKYTDQLLNVLAEYGVKATFFVTDQFPDYENMIKKEYEAGHTVAIHTYSHDFSKVYAGEEAYFADLQKMSDICEKETGVIPDIIRFPGGSSNTVSGKYCSGIMTDLTKAVEDKGYVYCDWNVDSNDAGGAKTAEEVASNVIAGLKKHKVSYVLQHDIKSFSVDAVEQIIEWGLANGYSFLPLTDTTKMCHHGINN